MTHDTPTMCFRKIKIQVLRHDISTIHQAQINYLTPVVDPTLPHMLA